MAATVAIPCLLLTIKYSQKFRAIYVRIQLLSYGVVLGKFYLLFFSLSLYRFYLQHVAHQVRQKKVIILTSLAGRNQSCFDASFTVDRTCLFFFALIFNALHSVVNFPFSVPTVGLIKNRKFFSCSKSLNIYTL